MPRRPAKKATANQHPEAAALLRAVLEAPDDDAPRLVLADWWEEHGGAREQARAEFVRVQVELARIPDYGPRAAPLRRRELELRFTHEQPWDPEARSLVYRAEYRRGFVEDVEFHRAGDFLGAAERLLALAPVRRLYLGELWEEDVPALASSPWLARLCGLGFRTRGFQLAPLRLLLASPQLSGLTELDLSGMDYNGPEGARVVAGATNLTRLAVLDLRGNHIGPEGARALAPAPHLAGLTTLLLGADDGDSVNEIGPTGARALARSPYLTNLTRLDLDENDLGDAGAKALAASANLARVTDLVLSYNELGNSGLKALARSPHTGSLKRLDLRLNDITDAGIKALASSAALAGLEALDLSYNEGVGDAGARALAASPHLAGLTSLRLAETGIGEKGEVALRERFGDRVHFTEV